MIESKKLALGLARIAVGDVPLGQYSEMIQAVQAYAAAVLDEQGIEPDPDEIETWPEEA